MKKKKRMLEHIEHIEEEFFEIDEAAGQARVNLHFESPEDIFDGNCRAGMPIFADDLDERLQAVFDLVPAKYQIALTISFDDMAGYMPEEMERIFRKNLLLSAKSLARSVRARYRLAWGLIAAGFVAFVAMMLIGNLWESECFWHEVFFYFLDIAATVLFWEAAGILLVETREHRATVKAYRGRFSSVHFICDQ